MKLKELAIFALLLSALQTPVAFAGQAGGASGVTPPAAPPSTAAPQGAGAPVAKADCVSGPCDYQSPHVTIATSAPAPAPWPLQDRIAWAANLVLVVLGYAGIMLAISILRKIERQTRYGEAAATAAAESAQAVLLQAQAIVQAERPWILVTVEPSRSVENGFAVVATNRGRGPARIAGLADEMRIVIDEAHLPAAPEYRHEEPDAPLEPIILLPGESTGIKSFSRGEVEGVCGSKARLQRVENWEEKIYLYGRLIYTDLIAREDQQTHRTDWCSWYIHGRQKSAMVMSGLPKYTQHT